MPFVTTWMDFEILYYLIYMWNLKKKNQTRGNREWWLSGVVGRENEKLLVKEYTLSVVRRISSGESNIRHGDYS